jgi:hypothetical protein
MAPNSLMEVGDRLALTGRTRLAIFPSRCLLPHYSPFFTVGPSVLRSNA